MTSANSFFPYHTEVRLLRYEFTVENKITDQENKKKYFWVADILLKILYDQLNNRVLWWEGSEFTHELRNTSKSVSRWITLFATNNNILTVTQEDLTQYIINKTVCFN